MSQACHFLGQYGIIVSEYLGLMHYSSHICKFTTINSFPVLSTEILLKGASGGWSGDAMVLGKLPVPGRPTILITVGQGPIALTVGAGGGGLDIFTLIYPFSSLSPCLWETAGPYLWLVGCFWFNGPLRQYFSLYRAVSQREGEREEKG